MSEFNNYVGQLGESLREKQLLIDSYAEIRVADREYIQAMYKKAKTGTEIIKIYQEDRDIIDQRRNELFKLKEDLRNLKFKPAEEKIADLESKGLDASWWKDWVWYRK